MLALEVAEQVRFYAENHLYCIKKYKIYAIENVNWRKSSILRCLYERVSKSWKNAGILRILVLSPESQ